LANDLSLVELWNHAATPAATRFEVEEIQLEVRRWMNSLIQLRGQENQLLKTASRPNPG
jgi:hypothetical protein